MIALGLITAALALPVSSGDFALRADKALTAPLEGSQVIEEAVIIVRDGRIAAIGPADETPVPADLEVIDLGDRWLAPGLIDLHCHVAGSRDTNDSVYQLNPGLRVYASVVPRHPRLEMGLAGGVTTVLFIPGSGTNIGGQGVLLKTGHETYEEMVLREVGSLKIAQGDNPTRWAYGMGRGLMNYHIRSALREGREYAAEWDRFEETADAESAPQRKLELDVFRPLFGHETQVSTHTQYYQLVLTSITMLKGEFDLDVYIDHGSFDSYLTGPLAEEMGVAAILGPREIMAPNSRRDTDGRIIGSAWGFQEQGVSLIGFNTDSPNLPQEELSVQAAMGTRYGLDNDQMQGLRGLTIVPAVVAGIEQRVGSLEVGKDADLLIVDGDPLDPRTSIERVYIDGDVVYDALEEGKRW